MWVYNKPKDCPQGLMNPIDVAFMDLDSDKDQSTDELDELLGSSEEPRRTRRGAAVLANEKIKAGAKSNKNTDHIYVTRRRKVET
jgi:hypothetical protein